MREKKKPPRIGGPTRKPTREPIGIEDAPAMPAAAAAEARAATIRAVTTPEIEAIRARHKAATPGPYKWFGWLSTRSLYLATTHSGRMIIMDFCRWGMQSAQPRFPEPISRGWRNTGLMCKAADIVRTKPYGDNEVLGFDNANAVAIAESWQDIETLLAALDREQAKTARLRPALDACVDALDRLMGDTDTLDDGTPEFRAMQFAIAALTEAEADDVVPVEVKTTIPPAVAETIKTELEKMKASGAPITVVEDPHSEAAIAVERDRAEKFRRILYRVATENGCDQTDGDGNECRTRLPREQWCDYCEAKQAIDDDGLFARRATIAEENAELRATLLDLVGAMELWGSWEDGIPEAGQDAAGSVGNRYDAARVLLGLEPNAVDVGRKESDTE